jgi:hypothetical protein
VIADSFGQGAQKECPETLPVSGFVENFKLLQVRLAQVAGIPRDDQQRALVDSSATPAEIEVKIYLLSIVQAWNHRSFFSPSDRRVNLGPDHLQPGDLVYIIANAYTPFIIRPRRDNTGRFQLIGEAYVDGIMHGEFLGKGRPEYETIRIS